MITLRITSEGKPLSLAHPLAEVLNTWSSHSAHNTIPPHAKSTSRNAARTDYFNRTFFLIDGSSSSTLQARSKHFSNHCVCVVFFLFHDAKGRKDLHSKERTLNTNWELLTNCTVDAMYHEHEDEYMKNSNMAHTATNVFRNMFRERRADHTSFIAETVID